ncbi:hypothetical protein RHGRI_014681 [Rhododendron griersonianum]|uniref:Uncharacterized protein n=1 Tax=Rhododendron griersonianum TaxID=479676 RepID=A0AAV6KAA1_9ERIC|nr:hypothetical protein RHGRI_014681 [Rhododendron griersonianum]
MEVAIIGGIIATITGELAVSQIIKESSRFSRVREDLDWIVSEMRRIQSYLEDAEAKQFRTKGVSNFIRDIWDLAYDVEDIIDTYFPKIGLSRSRWKRHLDFRNERIARGFVKEVEGIRKRAEDIRNARLTYGIDESRRSCEEDTWDQRRSFPHLDEPNVVGFDNLIKSLKHKVLDNDDLHHRVVSIIGFPGLGKTTLARKVYNSARKSKVYNSDRQRFDCAAWICVSERPNVKKLLQDIAGQLKPLDQETSRRLFYKIIVNDPQNICETQDPPQLKNIVAIHGNETDHYPALFRKTSSLRAVFCFVRRYPWNSDANKNLLRDSKFLRVLSVEEGNDIPRFVLTEICNLRQLTYLKLGFPYVIVRLPHAISNLKSLLTLDLRELLIVSLPNVIWSMEQLRHILLPFQCYTPLFRRDTLDVFHPVEVSLPNLQTLYGMPGDLFKADRLHKLTSLRTLRVNLKKKDIIEILSDATPVSHKLEELSLVGHFLHPPKATSLNFSRYELLSELRIESIKLNELSHDKLPPNLTKLTLVRTQLTTDPTEALKKLEKLKFLKLSVHSYLGKELVCSGGPGNFPQLEVLEMECLTNLEMVAVGEGGMPRLRDFRILHCSPETQIPHKDLDSGLARQSFPHLDEPNVVGFDKLIETLVPKVLDEDLHYRVVSIIGFAGLGKTTLARKVYNSARQSKVYNSSRQRFDCAAWICVSESPNEKKLLGDIARQTLHELPGNLFKADWLHKITSLRTLRVNEVNKDIIGVLSDAAPVSHNLEVLSLDGCVKPLLKTASLNLVRYDNLFELCIWGVKLNDLSHDKLPPNLIKLDLFYTDLTTSPTEALKKLQKLKFLELHNDSFLGKELVFSGEPGYFPRLEVLEIEDLPNLERVVVEEGGLPRLRDFMIRDCSTPETLLPDRVRNAMRTN